MHISKTGIARDLEQRAQTGKPIRLGIIGSGEMGTDLVTQVSLMDGIEIAAISTYIRNAWDNEAPAVEPRTVR